jgi:carbamoyl-phosphate synthase large subunit
MITLLITGVGGPLGQALIKAARKSAVPCRVVGIDRHALSVGLHWVDSVHVVTSATEPESYLAELRRVCLQERVNLILPGSDGELMLLSAHVDGLRKDCGATVVASAPDVLAVALDKCETAKFLEAHALNFPRTARLEVAHEVDELVAEFGFPLLAKPCRGSGSRGIAIVRSEEELAQLRLRDVPIAVQEYLLPDEEEYTVAVYTQGDGRQAGSIALKRELVAGNTYRAFVAQNPAVLAEAEAVVRALRTRGPCNVQLRLTDRGPVTFEVNPRFSGTSAMRAHFGFNEVEMAIRDYVLNEPVPRPAITPGIALRYWDEVYLAPDGSSAGSAVRPVDAGQMRSFSTAEADEWSAVLRGMVHHDFYFLPGYHALAESRGEGEARLFVFEQNGYRLALPLLLRAIPKTPDAESSAGPWLDATSVYGYAGPLASHEAVPKEVIRSFQASLRGRLRELRVISAFSRLHPLLAQRELLDGIGEWQPGGETVSIDLTASAEAQRGQYAANARSRLNHLRRQGATCHRDADKQQLAEFVEIYYETMRRVAAKDHYFFEESYFHGLAEKLGPTLQLFVAKASDGKMISGGLFTFCDGIVQYHLGGTRDSALKLSPMTLVLDAVRAWGHEIGARVFHLGGGVGAHADTVFQFKTRFSPRRHAFATWRWIITPEVCESLVEAQRRSNEVRNLEPVSSDYFPPYRASTRTRTDPIAASARAAHAGDHHIRGVIEYNG